MAALGAPHLLPGLLGRRFEGGLLCQGGPALPQLPLQPVSLLHDALQVLSSHQRLALVLLHLAQEPVCHAYLSIMSSWCRQGLYRS